MRYPEENFKHWVEKVNIWDLEDKAVNFALAESIVTRFEKYHNTVVKELSKSFDFQGVNLPGQVRNIGSCVDGSKVGKVNEFDSLYVMNEGPFSIRASKKPGLYNVFVKHGASEIKIRPRPLRDCFAEFTSQLVSSLKLPNCLKHGGYNSSRQKKTAPRFHPGETAYSGLRYNGPAVTSQFLTDENDLLTWDLTPCVVFQNDELQEELRKVIQPVINQNSRNKFPQHPIHLIPDPLQNRWRVSTAYFEAKLLQYLTNDAPAKKALVLCKILLSLLKKWNKKDGVPTVHLSSEAIDVVKKLDRHIARDQSQAHVLEESMRFDHVWIPSDKRAEYNEDEKNSISINTAAVKHIIIKQGLLEEGAFASSKNDGLVLKLMQVVFKTLGNETEFFTDHAFLKETPISHFAVLACNARDKVNLARSVCQQCRTLHVDAMTEVKAASKRIDSLIVIGVSGETSN